MKIVHVFFAFPTGGAETMLVDIMNEQVAINKVSLVVINNLYDQELIGRLSKKINVILIDRDPGSRNILKIVLLNLTLWRLHPDLIHCHDHTIIRYVKFVRCKKILTVHDVRFPTDNFKSYQKLVAISNAVKMDILTRSGLEAVVVHNGIHVENISVRQPDHISPEIFKIVQIGRLDHDKKGQHILLNAIKTLIQNYQAAIRVDFIGDGPSLHYLRRISEELEIAGFVNFLGLRNRDFIYTHIRDYHLLVQPSFYEGFGLTVAEAMTARVPVLVSGIDGPMEIIGNGKFGYFFDAGNSFDCAQNIEQIILNYITSGSQEKTTKARLFAEQNFSIRETVKKYQALYTSLISIQ